MKKSQHHVRLRKKVIYQQFLSMSQLEIQSQNKMNPNLKRIHLENDLYQALNTMNTKTLESALYTSNLSKVRKLTNQKSLATELSHLFIQSQKNNSLSDFFQNLNLMIQKELKSVTLDIFIKHSHPEKYKISDNRICYCKELITNSYMVSVCIYCNKLCHKTCINNPDIDSVYQCPECFIKTMDPFSEVKQVLESHIIKIREKSLEFQINLSKIEVDEYVQLRCIKIDSNPFYNSQISWPDNCTVTVNNIDFLKLKPLPINSALKRRQDKAIELPPTQYRRKTKIQIKIKTQYTGSKEYKLKNCPHLFAIVVTKNKTISELKFQTLNRISNQNIYRCALMQRFDRNNKQILTQKQRISTFCPFSKQRIQIPVRGSTCVHLQCFDLYNFLAFNKISRLYKCPIFCCSQRCHNLAIDPVLYKILKQDKMVQAVEFSLQGQKIVNKVIEPICLSSDEEDESISQAPLVNTVIINQATIKILPQIETQQSQNKSPKSLQIINQEQCKRIPQIQQFSKQKHQSSQTLLKSHNTIFSFMNNQIMKCSTSTQKSIQIQVQQPLKQQISKSFLFEKTMNKVNNKESKQNDTVIEIKDSDDQNQDERIQKFITQQKLILNEQRIRVEKKAKQCSILDKQILQRHFERLVIK